MRYPTRVYQNDQTSPQDPVSACALGNILNNKPLNRGMGFYSLIDN